MKKRAILTRIVTLVGVTLVLFAIMVAVFFVLVSPGIVTEIKANELRPRARTTASMISNLASREIDYLAVKNFITSESDNLSADLYVFDADGELLLFSRAEEDADNGAAAGERALRALSPICAKVLQGQEVTEISNLHDGRGNILFVGVPVYRDATQATVIGAVFLAKPVQEISAAFFSLTLALIISLVVVSILMLCFAYLVSRNITRPLEEVRNVSLAIASGDYTARADETAKGEIGELGRSINHLAARLDESISAIVAEKNLLMRVFDSLDEGLCSVDTSGNVIYANPALYATMDWDAAISLKELTELARECHFLSDCETVMQTQSTANRRVVLRDRAYRVLTSPTVDSKGRCEGVVVLISDISESVRLEETRREYVANVSHELKTPVSSIIGISEMLADGLVPEEQNRLRYYGMILREAQRLARLIEDLLELSRLQAGSVTIPMRKENLEELTREALDPLMPQAAEKGVELCIHESLAACPAVYTNADRIEQVLVILTDNALRFTPSGGSITYSATWTQEEVWLEVRDTGCGIAPEHLEHLFQRFYKVDSSYASQGTGLGLSIAREALKLIGQRIWVKSTPGQGSAFTFTVCRAGK